MPMGECPEGESSDRKMPQGSCLRENRLLKGKPQLSGTRNSRGSSIE